MDQKARRAQIEALRGIRRDHLGRIIRTPEAQQARIKTLESKYQDYIVRISNIEKELGYKPGRLPESSQSWFTRFWELIKELF